jgi:hypothetical protein
MQKGVYLVVTAVCSVGCVSPDEADELSQTEQAIQDGYPALTWMREQAVKAGCSATLIGRRRVATALHCVQGGGGTWARFYTTSNMHDANPVISVIDVLHPDGTDLVDDVTDSQGRHADLAVLVLASDAPSTSKPAELVWEYPGPGYLAVVVGSGSHDVDPGTLRYRFAWTDSDDDDDGNIMTTTGFTNSGDSGGSLYYDGSKLLGVHWGSVPDVANFATSVPEYIDFLVDAIGYRWPYGVTQSSTRYLAQTSHWVSFETLKACQYAANHSSYDGYNWYPAYGLCELVDGITGTSPSTISSCDRKTITFP